MKPTLSIEMTAVEGYVKPDLIGGRALIDALRSGIYKKCRGSLAQDQEDGVHYCCLGVKCALDKAFHKDTYGYFARVSYGMSRLVLPVNHSWRNEFGENMKFPDGFNVRINDQTLTLPGITDVNDHYREYSENGKYKEAEFSFNTIAMVLETAWNCI